MIVPITPEPIDIFLRPGEVYFGSSGVRIRTILGSCVSIILWHRENRIGGMCHYMLPERHPKRHMALDGKFADDAVQLLLNELALAGTPPKEYLVRVIGGGRMFRSDMDIGGRNIDAARRLLQRHGFKVHKEHLAGTGHRHVIFDIASGEVLLKHVSEGVPFSQLA